MKKHLNIFLLIGLSIVLLAGAIFIASCGKLSPFFGSATTKMTSSSLTAASVLGVTACDTYEGGFWKVTPSKISGKVVTVFFPVDNTEDEGVVVYGYYRPDIAQDNAALYDFDLSTITTLTGTISKKPGYIGGLSSIILMCYGYFDVEFPRGSSTETFRFAYGTSDPYVRGDVLYKNKTTGAFEWLDQDTNTFTATRPSNPYKIAFVADFNDPSHPTMKYFPLAAKVTSPSGGVSLPASLVDNYNLTFTVDFDYANTLLFSGITTSPSFESLVMADLIQIADMSQNRTQDWHNVTSETDRNKIITCSVTIESVLK